MPERGNNRIGGAAKNITGLHYNAAGSFASPSPATATSQGRHGSRDITKQGGGDMPTNRRFQQHASSGVVSSNESQY